MDNQDVISETINYVKKSMKVGMGKNDPGHDWWHVYRVWKAAMHMAEQEKADVFVVQLASLLHDIADWKFHGGDDTAGPKAARAWLESIGLGEDTVKDVCDIIQKMSFKGAGVESKMPTKEGMIVQDADRLDALGAIGIARCFSFNGHKGNEMHNPEIKPKVHESFEEYKKADGTAINHFYEKLLLLTDMMNTEAGRNLAKKRHIFMEQFLEQFYKEWKGEE